MSFSIPPRAVLRRATSRLLFSALLVLTAAVSLDAQRARSSLSGRVTDEHGAAVAGVRVRLKQDDAGLERAAATGDDGAFSFPDLVPGRYVLTATHAGFATDTQEVDLAAGDSREVSLGLHAGQLAEEVVVRASRVVETPEEVERIPGSIEVVGERALEAGRVFTSSEALRKVSGVNVRDEEGFGLRPNIGIRGTNPTRSTKVLLLEDGIPLTYAPYGDNASYYHPPIDRFETVEVLKGSGQILYGPQTVAGVINYVTRNPPARRGGFLTLTGGSRSYFNGHLNHGGTVGNTGLLFDYTRKQGAGARANTRSGLNDFNFKSVTALGARQALTFKFNYYGEDSNVTYSGLTEAEYGADPRQNPFRNDYFYGDRFGASLSHGLVFSPDAVLTTNLYGAHFRRHWWRQSSNSNERPNRLRTLSGGDPDCTGMADLNTTCGNQGRLRTYYFLGIEPRLRLNHNLFGVRSETDLGFRAHFETQERRQENGDLPTSRGGLLVENNERRNDAYSGFVQNRFRLGAWTVTPGVRVEHVRYERTNRLGPGGRTITGRTRLTQVVPGLGVSYSPSEKLTAFAGVHRGFAPPRTEDIISNTTGGSVDLDSELSWNYEFGLRSAPAAGLRFSATAFRMDYENQIVPASVAGGVGAAFTNGGRTLHQGFELSGRLDTGALLKTPHNLYTRFAYTALPVAKFRGARFSSVGGFTNVSVTGNRLPYAPEHLLNATFGYSHTSGFDAQAEANHVGGQFGDDLNTVAPAANGQRGLIPSYTTWNATANYRVERWRTTFFVAFKNLFDRTYIADRSRGILPGSPRLVQTGLKFNF